VPPLHRLAATGTVVLLALLLLVGCTGSPEPSPAGPSPDAEATATATAPVTLADLPVRRLALAREPFCSTVPGSVVAAALDVAEAPPVREDSDGDRVRLGAGGRDVAHEHGCTWKAGGATARAWVAVPPVNRALARELAESLRAGSGCTELTGAPSYGARSVSVTCEAGRGTRVVRAGVLGQAWMGCALDGGRGVAAQEVERRSELWCAGLLQAVSEPAPDDD
jgi:hypothetical protein